MKLSVIVPCRERNERADACLAEIRRQACAGGAELDLVVVTGVSPVGRARNEGLRQATGDYITWVDDDDVVLEGWWREIVRALSGRPDVVVFGWERGRDRHLPNLGRDVSGTLLRQVVMRDDLGGVRNFLCNKVFSRRCWEGIRFRDDASILIDYEMLPVVLLRAEKVVAIEESLYYYVANPRGITCSRTVEMEREMLDVAWRRYNRWKDSTLGDEALAAFVRIVYDWLAERLMRGVELRTDEWGLRAVALLKSQMSVVLRSHALGLVLKVKVLLAVLGWWSVQRLAWRIHNVKSI